MKMKNSILMVLTVFLIPGFVLAESTETYGELYIKEEIKQAGELFKIGLEYSNETSNTFQEIHEAILFGDYMVTNYLSLGLQGSIASASDRSLNNDVRKKLLEAGYRQEFHQPKNTLLAMVGLRPLAGRLNFFQKGTVPFELWLKLGYGRVFYDRPSVDIEALAWQMNVNSFIYKNHGLQVGIGQEIESVFSSEYESLAKFKVRVGWLVKF